MKLHDPQVRVFDAWGVWSYEGAPSWLRAIEAWFTSLGAEKTQVVGQEESGRAASRERLPGKGLRDGLADLIADPRASRGRFLDIAAAREWARYPCHGPDSVLVAHSGAHDHGRPGKAAPGDGGAGVDGRVRRAVKVFELDRWMTGTLSAITALPRTHD
jgi:hypothetical protein